MNSYLNSHPDVVALHIAERMQRAERARMANEALRHRPNRGRNRRIIRFPRVRLVISRDPVA